MLFAVVADQPSPGASPQPQPQLVSNEQPLSQHPRVHPRQHAGLPQEAPPHRQGLPPGARRRRLQSPRGGPPPGAPHAHEQPGGGLSAGQQPAQDQRPGPGGEGQQDGRPGGRERRRTLTQQSPLLRLRLLLMSWALTDLSSIRMAWGTLLNKGWGESINNVYDI